jgi:glycosyltransferase involved in cell wall biosynthesis
VGLWRLVLDWRPHVVHVMGIGLHPNVALARMTAASLDADLVAGFHGGLPPGPGPTKLISAFGLRPARSVIFTAPELARPWVEAGIVKANQIAIAMETSTLLEAEDQQSARSRTGLYGDPVCLVVARTDRVKDPLTTIAGFVLVAERFPAARLHWFGRAGTLDVLVRATAAALPDVADRIVFHGLRDHNRMAEVYSAADYLIQASRREWSGLAVMEAMVCGVIPIVSDIPSFHRMTGDGRAGRLFGAGDSRGLADALFSVEAGGRNLERGRVQDHFRTHLSFDALAADLETIYMGSPHKHLEG